MPRIPVSAHLIHDPKEAKENAKLFDIFVDLVPVDLISRDLRELLASDLLENIRQKVVKEGELRLPFGLKITKEKQ